jgi:hypothetical protein
MKMTIIAAICVVIGLTSSILPDAALAQGQPDGRLSSSEISELKSMLSRDQRELRDFQGLIRDLESAANESNGARRQKTIDKLQDAMAREIIQAEEKLNKEYFLRVHGEVKKRELKDKNPQGTSAVFSPDHQRLTHMQSIYRVCSRGARRAVNKETQGMDNYLRKVKDFALLMQTDIQKTKTVLNSAEGNSSQGASLWQSGF